MDLTGLITLSGILTYVGIVVYLANQVDAARQIQTIPAYRAAASDRAANGRFDRETVVRWMLYGLAGMTFVLGLTVLQTALFGDLAAELQPDMPAEELPQISVAGGAVTFGSAVVASFLSFRLITSAAAREQGQRLLARWGGRFNPQSQVHLAAVTLMLAVAVYVLANFVLQGGVEGVAQTLQDEGVDPGDVVFQGALEVVVALLGVGLAIRRGVPETLTRLGLRWPTRQDVIWGVGVGLACLLAMLIFNVIWAAVTAPELLEQQTSAAAELNAAFTTLPLAFILAASAAIGEEIWVRGSLQPVFGLAVSSVFFAILHIQVAFTPGTLLILGISLALGWLRQRHSTTAAIIAHFCYNFIPLALAALVVEAV